MEQTTSWIILLQTILLALFFISLVRMWLMYRAERRRNSTLWQHNDRLEQDINRIAARAEEPQAARRVA